MGAVSAIASLGGLFLSMKEGSDQRRIEKRRQQQEREDLIITRRMEEGESLAQVSGLGVSSASGSIQSFLKAQKAGFSRDLTKLQTNQSYSRKLSRYRRGKSIFEGVSSIGGAAQGTQVGTEIDKLFGIG